MKLVYEGKCDICTKPDGERGHNLQKCRVCSVLVHELCYGMVPTSGKDPNFICHACKSIGREIEVNTPSRVSGWTLRDVLGSGAEGVASFRAFLREEEGRDRDTRQWSPEADTDVNKLDFCIESQEFLRMHAGSEDGGERSHANLKHRAQEIFDTYLANDAVYKVTLQTEVQAEIESKLYAVGDGWPAEGATTVEPNLFNTARQAVLHSLERAKLKKYKRSAHYRRHLARQRAHVKQAERPTKCELCSVQNGTHAMHPLYDFDGKEGRQLVLAASGVGFRRQERRLAWVHTLCAMFICASERTGGLMYGCDQDGNWEVGEEEEEEDGEARGAAKAKVIDSEEETEEEEEDDGPPTKSSDEEEQIKFTKCEAVFKPLMDRLEGASDGSKDAEKALACIDSMITHVNLLTPPFIRVYQIGKLIKGAKKNFETAQPEVRARCKCLSAKMKRVYDEKKDEVPEGFEPIKNMAKPNDGIEKQKYKIGTNVSKESRIGQIMKFDLETNLYRVLYDDGGSEELNETGISRLLLSYTAWFCMAGPINGRETKASQNLKSLRKFVCVICKKRDDASNKCLRIPVQCSAGDPYEFAEFRRYHKKLEREKKLAKKQGEEHWGCAEPMHVGCARWGSDYARVQNKHLRMCYYFPGKPPAWDEPDPYPNPVANCFCRLHAIEVQEGMARSATGDGGSGAQEAPAAAKRKSAEDDNTNEGPGEQEPDAGSAEKDRCLIALKKKRRIMQDSDEDSE